MYIVVDLADPSELVTRLEPLWLAAGAEVDVTPVMTGEDLEPGMQAFGANIGKYAS